MQRIVAELGAERRRFAEVGLQSQLVINVRAAHGQKLYVLARDNARLRTTGTTFVHHSALSTLVSKSATREEAEATPLECHCTLPQNPADANLET